MQLKNGQAWENPHGNFFIIVETDPLFTTVSIGPDRIKHSCHTNLLAGEIITENGFVLSKKHIIQEFFNENAPKH